MSGMLAREREGIDRLDGPHLEKVRWRVRVRVAHVDILLHALVDLHGLRIPDLVVDARAARQGLGGGGRGPDHGGGLGRRLAGVLVLPTGKGAVGGDIHIFDQVIAGILAPTSWRALQAQHELLLRQHTPVWSGTPRRAAGHTDTIVVGHVADADRPEVDHANHLDELHMLLATDIRCSSNTIDTRLAGLHTIARAVASRNREGRAVVAPDCRKRGRSQRIGHNDVAGNCLVEDAGRARSVDRTILGLRAGGGTQLASSGERVTAKGLAPSQLAAISGGNGPTRPSAIVLEVQDAILHTAVCLVAEKAFPALFLDAAVGLRGGGGAAVAGRADAEHLDAYGSHILLEVGGLIE
mmetsp:Transcript_101138/g.324908  ORF Transcript_101138/g.324908 Transcript_101138/m.324908 type:complete len:353 (+) Transcript_101138:8395-9453(+)